MISHKILAIAAFSLALASVSSAQTDEKGHQPETPDTPATLNPAADPYTANQANLVKPSKPGGIAGQPPKKQDKIVVVTGVRFSYPLVQKWIDDYNAVNPDVQIIIESRGSADPAHYDILIEAFEPEAEARKDREFLYIARYAVLPVSNSNSGFTRIYSNKGLNRELIQQLFFHDLFADKDKELNIKTPYTIYTRLQKAGAPITFTKYFGFQQKDIRGKAIAGADEHLLKAILRDTLAVSYLPLNLIYDKASGKPLQGLTVLPVDLNGNGRVSDEEKFYDDLPQVVQHLEDKDTRDIHNVPIAYLHFSVDKTKPNADAMAFLKWVIDHGQNDLHAFGFLKAESARLEKAGELTSKRVTQ